MNLAHATWRSNVITGMWKFRSDVEPQILATLAREWKDAAPSRYPDIHIRSWGRDQYAICFTYVIARSYPMRVYVKNIRDLILCRLSILGIDEKALVGWDITAGAWHI